MLWYEQQESLSFAGVIFNNVLDSSYHWCLEVCMNHIDALKQSLEAMNLARAAHGQMLLSDPPQEAWKAWNVSAALTKAMTELQQAIKQAEQPARCSIPKTASQISDFIGPDYVWREHRISDVSPHEDDEYCVTAHDLISAFGRLSEQPTIKQDLTPEQWEPIKPKFVRNVDGVPCITLTEHEHIVKQITSPAHVATPRVPERPSRSDMKPLTDEQIRNIGNSLPIEHRFHSRAFARAIEAAHGITGETK
jgi:hypothetical protein